MLNLSPLFYTGDEEARCLHSALDLTPGQRALIAEAKTAIRDCLRDEMPGTLKVLGYEGTPPLPRFFTQGSWAYKTLNAPAQRPQQADCDDGCYLPMSFVSQTSRPSVATAIFFRAVERALGPLARERGWTLITDKATCVRVEVSAHAHVDVPLYAIPDSEFEKLRVAVENQATFDDALNKRWEDRWTALPLNNVLLAHREEDWIASDPRPVKDWFVDQVLVRGEQLRRVVRYLKAFRDWRWPSGGPSSILLMAAAAPRFEKRDRRDDLALLDVVKQLPAALRAGVNNPVDERESLTDRLGAKAVEEAARGLEELVKLLDGATSASSESQACIWMGQAFGPRFPNQADRIKQVSVAATIAATPAVAGPSELVGRTKAG